MNNDQDTFLVMEARTTSQLPPEEESARVDYDILLRRKIAELQEALEICKTRPVEAPVSIPNLSVIKESKAAEKRIAKLRELIAYKKLELEEKAEYELLKAEIEQANQEEEEVDGFVVHPHEDEQGNVDCDYRERFVKPLQQELCELEQRNTKLREEMHNYRYFLCEKCGCLCLEEFNSFRRCKCSLLFEFGF